MTLKRVCRVLLSAALGLLVACSASFNAARSETTTAAYLRTIARVDPTDHLAYMGTDGTYQYIFHSQLGGGGSYRVLASDWSPPETFQLGHGKPYVVDPQTLSRASR
jgi:hypothetical protein